MLMIECTICHGLILAFMYYVFKVIDVWIVVSGAEREHQTKKGHQACNLWIAPVRTLDALRS
jgi:hypothetical protein